MEFHPVLSPPHEHSVIPLHLPIYIISIILSYIHVAYLCINRVCYFNIITASRIKRYAAHLCGITFPTKMSPIVSKAKTKLYDQLKLAQIKSSKNWWFSPIHTLYIYSDKDKVSRQCRLSLFKISFQEGSTYQMHTQIWGPYQFICKW